MVTFEDAQAATHSIVKTLEEIVFIDSIYRGRYPAEAGLFPLGEPSNKDAEKTVSIAKRIFRDVQIALKK